VRGCASLRCASQRFTDHWQVFSATIKITLPRLYEGLNLDPQDRCDPLRSPQVHSISSHQFRPGKEMDAELLIKFYPAHRARLPILINQTCPNYNHVGRQRIFLLTQGKRI
jgi:hypothetical protein